MEAMDVDVEIEMEDWAEKQKRRNSGDQKILSSLTDQPTNINDCSTATDFSAKQILSGTDDGDLAQQTRRPIASTCQSSTNGNHGVDDEADNKGTDSPIISFEKLQLSSSGNCDDGGGMQISSSKNKNVSSATKISGRSHPGVAHDFSVNLNSSSSALIPHIAVFETDRVRAKILSGLDRKTLYNLRLVCRDWADSISKQLQETTVLTFKLRDGNRAWKPARNYYLSKNPRRNLKQLSALMNSCTSNFPCTSFVFHDADLIQPFAEPFLSSHGPHIKVLHLVQFFFTYSSFPILVEDFKRLILAQAPHLEHLILHIDIAFKKPNLHSNSGSCSGSKFPSRPDVGDEYPDSDSSTEYDTETETDPEAEEEEETTAEIDPDENHYSESDSGNNSVFLEAMTNPIPTLNNVKFKFKILEIYNKFPQSLLKDILENSPELVQCEMSDNKNLVCLVIPVNRLHLMTKLTLILNSKTIDSLEVLANAKSNGNSTTTTQDKSQSPSLSLQIRELNIGGEFGDVESLFYDPQLWPTAADVINKILTMVSGSCERLVWHSMRCLAGLQIPVMPHVREMRLYCEYYGKGRHRLSALPTQFFPAGLSFRDTFPRVQSVQVENNGYVPCHFHLLFDQMETVRSVTSLSLYSDLWNNYSLVERFRKMFPEATLSKHETEG